ncbi:LamG domain-containing protein [Cellulosimicrobium sp. Marseille-Q4280]|uniref:LamG domain-containing protein n=1 Tax=Cellulosimicrobium sp. Marseille-Q4280 TaxID=2937992 RepID=UPI00203CC5C1|nr:LamG domain-containing protein [Cellulosimicrobium sp. Marseille-Q4280]
MSGRVWRRVTAVVVGAALLAGGLAGTASATTADPGSEADQAGVDVVDVVTVGGVTTPRTVIRSAAPRTTAGFAFRGPRVIGGCTAGALCQALGETRVAWDFSSGLTEAAVEGNRIVRATLEGTARQSAACRTAPVTVHAVGGIDASTSWSTHAPTWGDVVTGAVAEGRCDRWGAVTWDVTDAVRQGLDDRRAVALGLSVPAGSGSALVGPQASLRVEIGPPPGPAAIARGTSDPPGPCAVGDDRPSIRSVTPSLVADVEGVGNLRARFAVSDVEDGVELWSAETMPQMAGGGPVVVTVPAGVMVEGRAYSWDVRAATPTGPWSAPTSCEVVPDLTPPVVTPVATPVEGEPAVYREGLISGGVGIPGAFVLSSDEADVRIAYSFSSPDALVNTVAPGTRVDFAPSANGPHTLYMRAVDGAGWVGPTGEYRFQVARTAPMRWSFDEGTGLEARNAAGTGALTLSGPDLWGDGLHADFAADPTDRALVLRGGESAAWSQVPLVATDRSYSVSATVRADDAGTTRVAVSQAGARTSAFALGQREDAACGTPSGSCWAFWTAGTDVADPELAVALSGVEVRPGSWVRLTGIHDARTQENRLYVCEIGTVDEPAFGDVVLAGTASGAGTGWASGGALQLGRGGVAGAWSDPWAGTVDRLSVADGVLTESDMFRECYS